MMNRAAGIGSLMRAGPAPGRAGLSHLGRGEMVLPRQAMQADPRLRQHAMQSMAQQGRNPLQYLVGAQNSRNPMTGRREFADMIYTDKGWVSPDTGQPMDFSGTAQPYNDIAMPESWVGSKVATLPQNVQDIIAQNSASNEVPPYNDTAMPEPWVGSKYPAYLDGSYDPSGPSSPAPVPPASAANTADSGASGNSALAPSTDLLSFERPETYDEWRRSRNPSGKGVPNVLFGQTQTAGSDSGVVAQQMMTPNVMAGQIPVPEQQWGTPNTALGMARNNTANDPSILKSGYTDMSMMPPAYSNAFGGSFGGNQSGIAFSGGQSGQQFGQQPPYQNATFGMSSAFKY